jgi:hypothetical protein
MKNIYNIPIQMQLEQGISNEFNHGTTSPPQHQLEAINAQLAVVFVCKQTACSFGWWMMAGIDLF